MKLFGMIFGSRWFWALLFVGLTVGYVELDRRDALPWRQAAAEPVEPPTADLGEPGDALSFEDAGAIPPGFETIVDTDERSRPFAFDEEFDFPSDTPGFDDAPSSAGAHRTERPLSDDGFGEREIGDDLGGDDLDVGWDDDSELVQTLDDPRDGRTPADDVGFDPLTDEPFSLDEPAVPEPHPEPIDDGPLDPATAYELPLEKVDPAAPASSEPPREEDVPRAARLVLDVTAPLRMQPGDTATFEVVVRNRGNEPADDVVLLANLDDGITMPGRTARAARKRFGTLAAGEVRRLLLDLRTSDTGRPCVHFGLEASDADSVQKRICVRVGDETARREGDATRPR